jgi:hypothetical protein
MLLETLCGILSRTVGFFRIVNGLSVVACGILSRTVKILSALNVLSVATGA